ncbi:helix-turn-helix domain-containing protein [Streptomyces sp. WAC 00631]|uniref:helix-turn-helix domain-containing protein n=1 Tax=Streptomyces sp. WAC 00631 TaxID=2203201 RepID=UPI000F799704|nr:helix-turn-helix domain-containing protein [Streptomyces sp. WAC 00631]MCC5034487.1 helix-turn-helix domain-containing protein [Streptomyces sp. WAC 00631]
MNKYASSVRQEAIDLMRRGVPNHVVAKKLGAPLGTVSWWRHEDRKKRGEPSPHRTTDCPRCTGKSVNRKAYSYLLGLYLGDGHIISRKKQHHLSIFCTASWTGLIDEAEKAMRGVMAHPRVGRRHRNGCVEVKSFTQHWICLFPQHGPGKKHNRLIALEPWQQEIVDEYPWEFLRGLVHSDGCRVTNWTTKVVRGERKRYEYPRYFFTNKSDDIRRIYTGTLDKLGITWTHCTRGGKPFNISVARRADVALLDEHIGPKH